MNSVMSIYISIQITRLVATDIDVDEGNRVPITYAITSITPTPDIIIDCKYFIEALYKASCSTLIIT